MELHTKVTNKIRVLDAFKNLQFISCFFDGFVIIRLKSYLQERFCIILPLFQKLTNQNQTKKPQITHPKPKHKPRKLLKSQFGFFLFCFKHHHHTKSPKTAPLHPQT